MRVCASRRIKHCRTLLAVTSGGREVPFRRSGASSVPVPFHPVLSFATLIFLYAHFYPVLATLSLPSYHFSRLAAIRTRVSARINPTPRRQVSYFYPRATGGDVSWTPPGNIIYNTLLTVGLCFPLSTFSLPLLLFPPLDIK